MADETSFADFKCSICLEILIEPVQLPCKHELCKPCFRHNVEEANFVCPVCRRRIASWARKCNREGTLVNQKRWSLIQKRFPKQCLKRLQGDTDDSEEEIQVAPKRVLAKSGELRQEYENEMKQILQEREKQERASEELVKTLLEEEKDVQLKQEKRNKDDEEFAKQISEEIKKRSQNLGESSVAKSCSTMPKVLKEKNNINKRRKRNSNAKSSPASYTLDKYFFSRPKYKDCNASENDKTDDLEFAKALQKQYDQEAIALSKRDDYMLRKTLSGGSIETETTTKYL